jgi:phage FluMu gp28-like protein
VLTNIDNELLYLADPVCRVEDKFDIDFKLDPVQEEFLRCTSNRIITKCCRQWGKSSIAAMRAAAAAEEGKGLILIVAPSDRQARECFAKCSAMLHSAHPMDKFIVDGRTEIIMPNRARIVAIPTAGQIRGFSAPRKIIIDEAAFSADEDYKGKIRPMLSHGGQVELLSTPFGKRGFFYEIWQNGGSSWKRFEVPASKCTHIPREFLEEERMALGPVWYSQEYEGVFLDSVSSFFDMDAVRAGLQVGIEPLFVYTPQGSSGANPDIKPLFDWRAA